MLSSSGASRTHGSVVTDRSSRAICSCTGRPRAAHDWDRRITACVARLRAIAGTAPDAPDLTQLVGELLLKSPDFAGLRERCEVTGRKPADKTFQHPRVGTLTPTSRSLHVEGTPGQRIGACTAEPGSPDHGALLLLDMTAPVASVQNTAPPLS
ncbi:hypothetical protein ACFVH0_03130 [Streptomyces sp. NPDC127117]|uniref:MmyB family transcriptional regulator n=1 Tax=Streptomyces sp. NPDC127117 TaxID=3345368 RepID=UPI00363F1933